jgi:hypothetical protein
MDFSLRASLLKQTISSPINITFSTLHQSKINLGQKRNRYWQIFVIMCVISCKDDDNGIPYFYYSKSFKIDFSSSTHSNPRSMNFKLLTFLGLFFSSILLVGCSTPSFK